MRLLEFVACCGASAAARRRAADAPEEESETAAMAARIPEDQETPSSLAAQCARKSHRRRKRGASAAAEEWKPSLCSISEDAAVAIEVERIDRDVRDHVDRVARSERPVKRKSAQGSSRTIVSVYSSDQRRPTFQTMIPAFSPTPFMF